MKRHQQHPHFKERSFGISVGSVLLAIAAVLAWRKGITAALMTATGGAALLLLGAAAPASLKWPSAAWWKFAQVLGYVNARIILTIAFAVIFVPLGVLWRLIGRDPLATRRASFRGWTPYPARYTSRAHFRKMY